MIIEIWKAVPGLCGVEVSNQGGVRGHDGPPPCRTTSGYVHIYHERRRYLVHRLVCLAWHGPAPAGTGRALHWNDIKHDNRAENLRWGNGADNIADMRRNGIAFGPAAWKKKR